MRNKKGFTLSEVMVTIAILGILAAVIVPSLSALKPNVEKLMFRKAYRIAEAVISDMISDTTAYPLNVDGESSFDSPAPGFNFCEEFAKRVNTVDGVNCSDTDRSKSFTTTDGVEWAMKKSFSGNSMNIYIDVDTKSNVDSVSEFTINVTKEGKVSPVETIAKSYLMDPFTTRGSNSSSSSSSTSSTSSSTSSTSSSGGGTSSSNSSSTSTSSSGNPGCNTGDGSGSGSGEEASDTGSGSGY